MTTCKSEAVRWVHRYAIGGAVFAALPLPFTTSGLTALEAHMLNTIGEVYEDSLGGMVGTAAKGTLALASRGLKRFSKQATTSVPKQLSPIVRGLIAGAAIELIGLATILHFEGKNPKKFFRKSQDTQIRDASSDSSAAKAGRQNGKAEAEGARA